MYSISPGLNPLTDTTEENCMVSQRGPVWFLAGVWGQSAAIRSCSVPEGKSLFFPVFNYVYTNTPNVCGQDSKNLTVSFMRTEMAKLLNAGMNLTVKVDETCCQIKWEN